MRRWGEWRIFLTESALVLLGVCVWAKGNICPESVPKTPPSSLRRTGDSDGWNLPWHIFTKESLSHSYPCGVSTGRVVYLCSCTYVGMATEVTSWCGRLGYLIASNTSCSKELTLCNWSCTRTSEPVCSSAAPCRRYHLWMRLWLYWRGAFYYFNGPTLSSFEKHLFIFFRTFRR